MFKWDVVHGGKAPPRGASVGPLERLSWGRTLGLGAQHVVAMFGATFVFPLVMGLDPNLAIMFSGICTIMFLLIVQNRVPSYLGTSASFVAAVAAIRGTGRRLGRRHRRDPGRRPRSGAGRRARPLRWRTDHPQGAPARGHRRGGHADRVQPRTRGRRASTGPRTSGSHSPPPRSWCSPRCCCPVSGPVSRCSSPWSSATSSPGWPTCSSARSTSVLPDSGRRSRSTTTGSAWDEVEAADWIGLPSGKLADGVSVVHGPSFSLTFILLVLPGVIALIAENTGHVKAVAEMTGDDLDPYMGRAIGADGIRHRVRQRVRRFADHDVRREHRRHGCHQGVLDGGLLRGRRSWRSCSACARSSVRSSAPTPGGVLGGITVVLYGMIGLVGAKIWVENGVDFGDPVNLVGLAGRPDRRHRRRHAADHRTTSS